MCKKGLLLFFMAPLSLFAQVKFSNLTASAPESRVVYIGIENRFQINKTEAEISEIIFKGGRVSHLSNDSFNLLPGNNPGINELIFVTRKGRESVNLHATYLPSFEIDLQGRELMNGESSVNYVSREDVIKFGKIRILSIDPERFYQGFHVKSFLLKIKDKEFDVKGEVIPEIALEEIAKLKRGDKIKIQYLHAGRLHTPLGGIYISGIYTFDVR